MSSQKSPVESFQHSAPIPIATSRRARSGSVTSSSSGSASSPSEVATPTSASGSPKRITIPSPGSSPILSYFYGAQSPSKSPVTTAATFPFRKFAAPPVFEEEEIHSKQPSAVHARRASTIVAGRFAQPAVAQTPAIPEPHMERGAGFLRRLSLSSPAFAKPQLDTQGLRSQSPPNAPPNTAVSPVASSVPYPRDSKPRRSATISIEKPRRAPSPMGERILKGHFDGFN